MNHIYTAITIQSNDCHFVQFNIRPYSSSFFGDLFGSSSAEEDEVDAYLATAASEVSDLLEFWKKARTMWPALASVARGILSVPATSTPSERSFSVAGRTLETRRSRLSPDTVDELLFLHGL